MPSESGVVEAGAITMNRAFLLLPASLGSGGFDWCAAAPARPRGVCLDTGTRFQLDVICLMSRFVFPQILVRDMCGREGMLDKQNWNVFKWHVQLENLRNEAAINQIGTLPQHHRGSLLLCECRVGENTHFFHTTLTTQLGVRWTGPDEPSCYSGDTSCCVAAVWVWGNNHKATTSSVLVTLVTHFPV